MLHSSNFPIEVALAECTKMGLSVGFLVPTETGLNKSIMDAHAELRAFLSTSGIHDFAEQGKGTDSKKTIPANFILGPQTIKTKVSLYRPETKNGDPRIWIYGLGNYAGPNDLIALVVDNKNELTIFNCSDSAVWSTRLDVTSPLGALAVTQERSPIASELLARLESISRRGFVPSQRQGDTGVGFTLESLLGIKANSSKSPDFHGIEIKSGRVRSSSNKQTLFSKVPDWKHSRLKNAKEILSELGYRDENGRTALYCSITSTPNPQGLSLKVSDDGAWVDVVTSSSVESSSVVRWQTESLQNALAAKHMETFWVKANVQVIDGVEHFHYVAARHTRKPIVTNLPSLIEIGRIQVDFVMHIKENGSARDHGYLFRTTDAGVQLLFPPAVDYKLI
jgi:MvaI/BcnI restriction endonuclease family